jgi:hypothetical protein
MRGRRGGGERGGKERERKEKRKREQRKQRRKEGRKEGGREGGRKVRRKEGRKKGWKVGKIWSSTNLTADSDRAGRPPLWELLSLLRPLQMYGLTHNPSALAFV